MSDDKKITNAVLGSIAGCGVGSAIMWGSVLLFTGPLIPLIALGAAAISPVVGGYVGASTVKKDK